MKRFLAALLALLTLCGTLTALAEDTAALDAAIEKILRRHKASCATVMAAKDGQVVYTFHYGLKDRKQKLPVDSETFFKIASVSKMVTGIRVMMLVEEGLLDLDTDISTYLGYKVVNPYYPKKPLTLRMLMSHTSSIKSSGGYSNEKNPLSAIISSEVKKQSGNF